MKLRQLANAVLCAGICLGTDARAQLEEVIVTAQKRQETIQSVPIAITAFDAEALAARQINSFFDLQFNTPSVNYTKGQFDGSNFQIRGIGNALVAASADQGVGVHINDAPIFTSRLFETEYFDISQVQVLRGPQGTLHGRNSTGGSVNMLTRKPTREFEGYLDTELGNYDHRRVKGAVNLQLGDRLALRLAGIWLDREGYTDNIYNGEDVDGRDQYSLRSAFRWEPGEDTKVDLMLSWFDENSSRTRSQKQMCHNDPSALLGCLPDRLAFENPNPSSQFAGNVASSAVLGPLGLFEFGSEDVNQTSVNPPDPREVNADFMPVYKADESLAILEVEHLVGDYTISAVASYQDTSVFSQQDYLWSVSQEVELNPLLADLLPETWATLYADGTLPLSAVTNTYTGVVGGNIRSRTNRVDSYDQSNADVDQQTIELRFASRHDGPLNFLVGGFYMAVEREVDYVVVSGGFDYFATLFPFSLGLDGTGWVSPMFNSRTDSFELDSGALFGELYYDLRDNLKLTAGLRYTVDEKQIRQRQYLLNLDPAGEPIIYPLGTDVRVPVAPDSETADWEEFTGRLVLDWFPEWEVTESTLIYGSYTRGYKGGGFNPPFDRQVFPDTPETFDPEFVDAFEIGTKNSFGGHRYQANFTAFYYDYEGLQVAKIVNRTSFNENTDAQIWGAEAEFLFAPDGHWLFNLGASWVKTDIGDTRRVDSRDPTGGDPDTTLIKDLFFSENCVVHHNGAPDPLSAGLIDSQFESCASFGPFVSLAERLPAPYTVDEGVEVDLAGNSLSLTPEYTVSAGVQYRWDLAEGYALTSRVDYYWQDDMWGRNFNRNPIDRIESWDVWNAQLTLDSADRRWYLRAWIRNIADDDNVTGSYLAGASSGLFTNLFLIEPRVYGIGLGLSF
jgi:outer membrane receptor protein involved in Fe transport